MVEIRETKNVNKKMYLFIYLFVYQFNKPLKRGLLASMVKTSKQNK